jgi:hypothetical protein
MPHISDWHDFNAEDWATYPKVNATVQVKFDSGRLQEGETRTFFPREGNLEGSSIAAWRYIHDPAVD